MSNLYRPGRNLWQPARGSQRPLWPFTINKASLQADGLIAWWPFAPPGGDTLFDLSGNGNNGTLTNMTPESDWVANEVLGGSDLDLDGLNDFITMGDVLGSVFAGVDKKFSIYAWVNHSAIGTLIGKWTDAGDNKEWIIDIRPAPSLSFSMDGTFSNWRRIDSDVSLTANVWSHLCITYDGSIDSGDGLDRIKIYINGRSVATSLITTVGTLGDITALTNELGIGARDLDAAPASHLTAQVDDVRIYNRVLRASEVLFAHESTTRWDLIYPLRPIIFPVAPDLSLLTGGSGNSPIFRVKHSPWGYM